MIDTEGVQRKCCPACKQRIPTGFDILTPAEMELVEKAAALRDTSVKALSAALGSALKTIEGRRVTIYRKTGFRNPVALVLGYLDWKGGLTEEGNKQAGPSGGR